MTRSTVFEKFRDGFHRHLDECRRCREQPFNLCTIGALLLRAAAQQAVPRG